MKNYFLITILCCFLNSFAQDKVVSGTVSYKTEPIPGANVVVKGTTRGVQTDFDGKYTIKAKAGEVLVFSFVGFLNEQVTVGAAATYNVSLKDGPKLEEVSYGPAIPIKRIKTPVVVIPLDSIAKKKNAYLYVVDGKAMRYRNFKKIKPETIEWIYAADPITAANYPHKEKVTVVIVNVRKNPN